ncbi:MAG: hypothetical protein DKM24_04250 [Candidatus Melainabacteria bacterium]|nr:MAG: hypothetical protein DKM24_04250 [Candidatus Melainabacteria bacterium]
MNPIFTSLIYLIVSCSMLIFSKWLFMRFAKYNMYEEIKKGNVTGIIPYLGFLLGVCAIQIGAFVGPSNTLFRYEILSYIMYSLMGSFLMIFSGYVVEKAILHKFSNVDEIVRDRNIGTAAVHFGMYLASGLIISACVTGETIVAHGRCYGVISTLIYYVMGMIFLILFAKLYDMLTPYSLLGEIEADNVAVGVAFGGNLIAIGLILMRATIGDIGTWQQGLILYFIDLSAIILLLPSVRFLLDRLIVKEINITKEIKHNNVAAGLGEAVVLIAFALLIFFMVDFVNMM